MAWIESHQELATSPKAKALARRLGIGMPQAVGHLHFLWWWAVDHASDGDLSKYDCEIIADAAGWDGDPEAFIAAMCPGTKLGGFIDKDDFGNYSLHDWYEYAGRLIEHRQDNVARTQAWRAKKQVRPQAPPVMHNEPITNAHVTDTLCVGYGATVPNLTVPNLTVPTGDPLDFASQNQGSSQIPEDMVSTGDEVSQSEDDDEQSEGGDDNPPTSKKPRPKPKVFPPDSDSYRVAEAMRESVLRRDPHANVPKDSADALASWAKDADLMLRVDNRPFAEAMGLLKWAERDPFWRTNILSVAKLRKQYSTLLLQKNKVVNIAGGGRVTNTPPISESYKSQVAQFAARQAAKQAGG